MYTVRETDRRYEGIEYFTFTNTFTVQICNHPLKRMEESFDTLEAAIAARDARLARLAANRPVVDTLQSPHVPQAKRYEPRREFATYTDPNLETRNHEA